MATTTEATDTFPIFHLEITDEHTLVLPPDLLRALGVASGDAVAISVAGGHGFISKVARAKLAQPVVNEPVPELKGLLRDYFTDHDDVMRFLEEERGPRPDAPPSDQ